MKLEFHPEAELELIEASVYYDHAVAGLGDRFEIEVRRATDLLFGYPRNWRSNRFTNPKIRVDELPV
jgi:hypothetical protein